IIRDVYLVPVNAEISAPSAGRVVVSAYLGKGKAEAPLKVSRTDKVAAAVTFGQYRLMPAAQPRQAPSMPVRYEFANELELMGYDIQYVDQKLRLQLYWTAQRQPAH